jgi:uncharacterized membrane protein
MRSTRDRILHAVSFEVVGLALVMPLGSWAFGLSLHDSGAIGVAGATLATVWNYVYNLGFDHLMQRLRGSAAKTLALRVLHAIGFEFGLLLMLAPLIALWLGVGLWQAVMLDLSFAAFYLVYAFVFTWAWDRLFPPAESRLTKEDRVPNQLVGEYSR